MEFSSDLPIIMSAGTLVALIWTIVHYTYKTATFKKEIEMKCQEVDERVSKIENLDLQSILTKI